MTADQKPAASLPIGVFDSGVGGLTVLRALKKALPHEDFLYLGDTARLPYGTKSGATVARYALQTTKVLVDQGVKLLVVACNTASAVALPGLTQAYPNIPVVGVIEPGARACAQHAPHGRIAVIATGSTVRGAAYQTAILRLRPEATIATRPAQVFVALAEEGWTDGPEVEAVAKRYLTPLMAEFPGGKPDCLVLGCTHFPVLAQAIRKHLPEGVCLVDSAETTAESVAAELARRGLLKPTGTTGDAQAEGSVHFFATDDPERFAKVGEIFLGQPLNAADITLVDL
ncbi:MAG TPA: glutamate racemase [Humidesulfovibrio sp.]|uniref:glutamate racemase n=1 Tax=Humidesulfovibrio sp. TaxID=2910988 RepID=UPI002C73249C|nr:glutamate racemase [Humidesulfovibrio sp.]HWR04669.1 glutamate racemase [Humidesulfovibrio sp.]